MIMENTVSRFYDGPPWPLYQRLRGCNREDPAQHRLQNRQPEASWPGEMAAARYNIVQASIA
jgi:hypothetical protein